MSIRAYNSSHHSNKLSGMSFSKQTAFHKLLDMEDFHDRPHTHMHIYTHTHAHTHTHTHICMHAHTHIRTHTHTHMHARTHPYTHTGGSQFKFASSHPSIMPCAQHKQQKNKQNKNDRYFTSLGNRHSTGRIERTQYAATT